MPACLSKPIVKSYGMLVLVWWLDLTNGLSVMEVGDEG
jgi:hypothetical protein